MSNFKISQLTPASPLVGTELVELVQGGVNVRSTAQDIANLGGGGGSGDVTAAANLTDNAVVRGDGGTKGVQTSAMTIADDGATVITSANAAAFAVGPNGATNPVLRVKADVASAASGIEIVPNTGSLVRLGAISSLSNCGVVIGSLGTGEMTLNSGNVTQFQLNGSNFFQGTASALNFNSLPRAFTSNTAMSFTGVAATGVPVGTETHQVLFNFSQTQAHQTGAVTLQRDIRFRPSAHSFTAASVVTDAAGFAVDGAPIAGNNATLTNASTIYSAGQNVVTGTGVVTNSYGLNITANTGATNNYAARFNGAIDLNGAGAGTSGQVLTSGGAGASCTWTTVSGGGGISAGYNMAIRNGNF